jgi:hypothetical protein
VRDTLPLYAPSYIVCSYCWAVLGNSEEMDAQRPDVFPNIAQMIFALRLQLRIIAKLPEQNVEDALTDLKAKGLM